jgi:small-conductance mechanosensitive channel
MNIQDLTFGIKDVIAIIGGVATVVSFYFALRSSSKESSDKIAALERAREDDRKEVDEKFLHAKNAKKANIMSIYEEIARNKEEFKEKEAQIYQKIEDIRAEQKDSHDKMSIKLDGLSTQISTISTNLAEITGYIRAIKEKK